jgi:type II secretory ATPase GspE/PulE/Tfp pilus assembly ATPase PilB-like protein
MPTLDALTMPLASLNLPTLLAQAEVDLKAPLLLVSWYKPIVMLVLFLPWAWVVSKIYDKHAAQFFLPRRKWNLAHMGAATLALLAVLLIGLAMPGSEGGFWIGFGLGLIVLGADLYAYVHVANRDERVPDRHHITWTTFIKRDEKKKKVVKGPAEIKYAIRGQDEKSKYTKLVAVPQAETPEMEVRVAAEKIYAGALKSRASQLDFGPTGGADGAYGVKLLVDGVYQPGETMPAQAAARIMDFFKSSAGLDVADRRRKLQGFCQFEDPDAKHTVRVTSVGGQGGLRVSLVLDPESAVNKKAEDLGMLPMQLEELKAIVGDGKGVVLVTAPRDNGRTTLLYSVIRKHDAYINNVQTVEIEPQAVLEGVRSNKFDAQVEAANAPAGSTGPEFATLVRSIMRRDPQVVGVAELPDAATAKEVSRADHERTRTYLSFNAPDAVAGVQAWVKFVGDQRAAGECLHGVVSGKLLRKLCTNCRVAYPPAPDMLKKLGIPEGKVQQLFKKGGQVLIKNKPEVCPVCQGSGYFGQDGVYELSVFSKDERDLVAAGNLSGLKAAMRKRNIPTIQQVAIRKAVDGITSVEEVMRITTGDAPPPSATGGGGSVPAPSAGNGSGGAKKPGSPAPAPPGASKPAAKG